MSCSLWRRSFQTLGFAFAMLVCALNRFRILCEDALLTFLLAGKNLCVLAYRQHRRWSFLSPTFPIFLCLARFYQDTPNNVGLTTVHNFRLSFVVVWLFLFSTIAALAGEGVRRSSPQRSKRHLRNREQARNGHGRSAKNAPAICCPCTRASMLAEPQSDGLRQQTGCEFIPCGPGVSRTLI